MATTRISFPPLRKSFLQLLGPSVILSALALSGGELLLWPHIAANYGLGLLWIIPIVLVLQFVVNMEIERYTLATGKSTIQNIAGSSIWLAVVFIISVVISLFWPAWMTTAGNLIVEVALGSDLSDAAARNVGLIITLILMVIPIIVFKNPDSYRLVERLSKYGLFTVIGIIILTVIIKFDGQIFWEGIRGFWNWGFIPDEIDRFDLLAGAAYGGVSGVLNFAQSEWVQSKGYGVAGLSESARLSVEFTSENSKGNFRKWWRTLNLEHSLVFLLANVVSIFLLAYLGRLLVEPGGAEGFGVLAEQVSILNQDFYILGTVFGLAAAVIFIMANINILDAIGRLSFRLTESLAGVGDEKDLGRRKFQWLRGWDVSRISIWVTYLGVGILFLSLLIPVFKQPFILLVTAASLSGILMWLYPPLLIRLNRGLPEVARPSLFRIIGLIMCTVVYGAVSLWALSIILPIFVIILIGGLVTGYQVWYVVR